MGQVYYQSPMRFPEEALLGAAANYPPATADIEAAGKVYPSEHVTGGRVLPPNRLTAREMDSVAAVCDTLLPSIDLPLDAPVDPSLRTFYLHSANMLGTPDVYGRYFSGKLEHAMLGMLRMALWFLSTWYGTLVMCGTKSLSCRFPFVQKFSKLDQKRREEIVLSWATSSIYLYRQLYRGLKSLIVYIYFTQLDEQNQNPTWKALGYYGPDPKLSTMRTTTGDGEGQTKAPLREALADISCPSTKLDANCPHLYYDEQGTSAAALLSCSAALSRAGLSVRALRHTGFRNPLPTIHCDAVVVGSGSGGGLVAGVLAQAGYKVVVLEKGDYRARGNLDLLEGPSLDQMYENGGVLITDDMGVLVLAGSTVGGGSAINWSASVRTPDHVMTEWRREHGLELFGSDAYACAMDVVCERMGVQCRVCGESLSNRALRKGCAELGYPVVDVPQNASRDHVCGWCCFGCKDGSKQGTLETWLVDMTKSGNGVILPRSTVIKVLHENKGRKKNVATGVLFELRSPYSGKTETFLVKSRVTVVACGSVRTPVLLKNSGLRNPNIGKHLHLHPVVMVWGYFPDQLEETNSYEGAILTAMSTVASNVETTGYGGVIQTPALHPGMFSVVTPWVSSVDFKHRMTRFARTAHIFTLTRDKGEGTVDASGSIGYRMTREDEEHVMKGVDKMMRILAAAGAEEIGTQHSEGARLNVKKASSHEFEKFVKAVSSKKVRDLSTPICSAHQLGSCRMGVHPATSAVDQRGETWEVEGLFVADASVLPTAIGVNPMVTVQSIAHCTAQSILEVLKRKTRLNSNKKVTMNYNIPNNSNHNNDKN